MAAPSSGEVPNALTTTKSHESDGSESGSQGIHVVTLGMFIIDEIEFLPPKPPAKDVLGGAGSYAALGARLFSPPPLSSTVGWIVDQGSDFPPAITALVDSWETSALLRHDPSRKTTRGWNGYVDSSERREFRYTTPKRRLTADDLTPRLLQSRSFHIICSPARCRDLVADITARRRAELPADAEHARPIFVWEPVPDLCTPDELLNCTNCLPLVDVCSPNHAELAGFMGDDGLDPETGEISTASVERACEQLLASMPLHSFSLVVRAGEKGCYVARNGGRRRAKDAARGPGGRKGKGRGRGRPRNFYAHGGLQPDTDMEALFAGLMQDEEGSIAREEIETDPGVERWIPAYHRRPGDGEASRVVDPTGGGNTFLGGLAAALARGKPIEEAAVCGAVAASFAIEQVGLPVLGRDGEGHETWNGDRVEDRLRELKERVGSLPSY